MIHLIHGIHTEGPSPVEGLISYLEGEVAYPDYGWIAGLETKIANPIVVGTLKPYVKPGDLMIGHSNGCAIIYDLLNQGVEVGGVVFINAALEQAITRPQKCPWIDVYFNSGDEITEAAKLGAELRLTDPVWGEMGHGGYKGTDLKITNINCGAYQGTPFAAAGMPPVAGHSDFFTPSKLAIWGPYLVKRLKEHS